MRYNEALRIINSDGNFLYEDKISEIENRVINLNYHAKTLKDKGLIMDSQKVSQRASRWESLLMQDMMKRKS